MIDKATIQRIKDVANIVEVVSDYVHLTRRGANYMGLCPFHNERTPSFSVSPRRNFCYCFSCHKGGSPVNFIMEKEGISYHDALLQLAKRYGIKVEERELSEEERKARTERESLMVANEWAMHRMEQDLRDTEEGRNVGLAYIYGRGVTEEAIKAFHLGYAIDRGQYLTPLMKKAGFDVEVLRKAGITGLSRDGREYDKFHGRVIFPVLNPSGKTVAFGARDLKGGPAKYVNSPESILYRKSNELYGIFQAKSEIVRQDKCYLVEGYLDVIGMWQSGMQNVVASSGTALTDGQISVIHRFTDRITLIYDGDAAGIKAALRGMDMLLSHKMKVKVLLLPDGHDPDSFARANTPESFRKYIEEHETDVVRFKTQVLMKSSGNSPQERAEAITSICRTLAHIQLDAERQVYVADCSRLLQIPEELLSREVEKARLEVIRELKQKREMARYEEPHTPSDDLKIYNPGTEDPTGAASAPSASVTGQMQRYAQGAAQGATQGPMQGYSQGYPQDQATANRQNDPAGSAVAAPSESTRRLAAQIEASNRRRELPLEPLERKLLKQCVRYGCLTLREENSGEEVIAARYVYDDMRDDNLEFTTPKYAKVFRALLELLPEFTKRYEQETAEAAAELERMREEGIREIAARGVENLEEIKVLENELEERLQAHLKNRLTEFSKDYPGSILASHEDSDVRAIATEMLSDKHVLSPIMNANGQLRDPAETIGHEIPRTLLELRHEIISMRLNGLLEEIAACGDDPAQAENLEQLQRKFLAYSQARSQMSRYIGDRVISCRFRINK